MKLVINMIYVLYHTDKPNHSLKYDIGTHFCIEDPVNTSFHLTINCPLTQELPTPPQFQWKVTLNGIDLSHEEIITFGLSVYTENDTFTLSGTISIGFDQTSILDVTCEVSNDFGNDTEKTSISMCSKYSA